MIQRAMPYPKGMRVSTNRSARHTPLVKACIAYLRAKGVYAWSNNTGAAKIGDRFVRFGEPGLPDILAIGKGGVMVGFECKTGTGRLSEAQEGWRRRFDSGGAKYFVVRSLDDVKGVMHECL